MSDQQTTWKSQAGYIWALIGSAVGFANVLSFSAQVYKNGGGAFLIPYFLALLLLGIPMLVLEGLIGQKWKLPLVSAYGYLSGPKMKILGWMAVLACLTIGGFYIVLTGYAAAYTFFSLTNAIPEDTKSFFLNDVLQVSPHLLQFGHFSWPIFMATCGVLGLTWFVLTQNIQAGIEKICSIFMPLMVVIITFFAITVCFLPGGIDAFYYYLKPDMSKLKSISLWRDIFGQLFFSLSLGLGIIVGYSRHTKQQTNIVRSMFLVAFGDFAVSFISGIAIFGCLAHISFVQNIPFHEILNTDSTFEIGFVLFPKILKTFGAFTPLIGTVFFACVFIAGITGVFSIIESIAGNIEVEFQTTRPKAVLFTICLVFTLGLIFCMGNALHIIDALVPMVLGTNMLIGGLVSILFFVYKQKILESISATQSRLASSYITFSLKVIAPAVLGFILFANITQEFQSFDLAVQVRWIWLIGALATGSYFALLRAQKDSTATFSTMR